VVRVRQVEQTRRQLTQTVLGGVVQRSRQLQLTLLVYTQRQADSALHPSWE